VAVLIILVDVSTRKHWAAADVAAARHIFSSFIPRHAHFNLRPVTAAPPEIEPLVSRMT